MTVLTRKVSQAEAAEAAADFQRDFTEWRRARPAWIDLTSAIRADRPAEELHVLAASAGLNANELTELRQLAVRARGFAAAAAERSEREHQLAIHDRRLAEIRSELKTAGAGRASELQGEYESMAERRRFVFDGVCEARTAGGCVDAAAAAGLL